MTKPAVLETGKTVNVPLFINEGELSRSIRARAPTWAAPNEWRLEFRVAADAAEASKHGEHRAEQNGAGSQRVKVAPMSSRRGEQRAGLRRAHGPDALGQIHRRAFPAPALRDSQPDLLHRFRARHGDATALGGGRILVLFVRRGSLADRVFRFAAPDLVYVFGHELTHALWVWLMGGRVSRFRVGRDGGHIVTDQEQFLDRARALFFPALQHSRHRRFTAGSALFVNVQPYGRLLYALIGVTWAFHFTFTCWMIPKNQTDLSDHGTFFSSS